MWLQQIFSDVSNISKFRHAGINHAGKRDKICLLLQTFIIIKQQRDAHFLLCYNTIQTNSRVIKPKKFPEWNEKAKTY